MPVPYEFNQARVRSPMAPKTVLGHSSKPDTSKFNLRRGQRREGIKFPSGIAIVATTIPQQAISAPSACSSGLALQPRIIFASELRPPGIQLEPL